MADKQARVVREIHPAVDIIVIRAELFLKLIEKVVGYFVFGPDENGGYIIGAKERKRGGHGPVVKGIVELGPVCGFIGITALFLLKRPRDVAPVS